MLLVAAAWLVAPRSHAQTGPLTDSSAWQPLGNKIEAEAFAFVGDPDDPTVWIGESGIWALTPGSSTWSQIHRRPSATRFLFIGDDPLAPDTIFTGTTLYRSVDGGQSYQRLEDPSIAGPESDSYIDEAIDRIPFRAPHHAGRLVAGAHPDLVYSDDGGDSWTRTADASPTVRIVFSVAALNSGRVLAAGFWGAVRSDDGGATFEAIEALYDSTTFRFDLHKITVLDGFVTGQPGDSEQGRVVLTGAEGGVGYGLWASDDEGATWTQHPLPGEGACSMGVDLLPLGTDVGGEAGWVAAAHCDGRVLVSTDGAETWEEIGRVPGAGPAFGTNVKVAALGPDGQLYVGVNMNGPNEPWQYRTVGRLIDAVRVAVVSEDRPLGGDSASLRVSPNPAHDTVTLAVPGTTRASVDVVVVDARGREVVRRRVEAGAAWTLDLALWAPGIYHASIEGVEATTFTVVR